MTEPIGEALHLAHVRRTRERLDCLAIERRILTMSELLLGPQERAYLVGWLARVELETMQCQTSLNLAMGASGSEDVAAAPNQAGTSE